MRVVPTELRLEALDAVLGLRLPAQLARGPHAWLPDGASVTPEPGPVDTWIELREVAPSGGAGLAPTYRLIDTEAAIDQPVDASEVDGHLEWAVLEALARHVRTFVLLHAGVVAWHGRAILLPGHSHAGKSSLTAALVRAGADYGSDDCAAIGPDGLIHPLARRMALRQRDGRMERVDVRDWGARVAAAPIAPGLVVVARYVTDATWCPRVLTPGEAVHAMIPHVFGLARAPARTLAALASVAEAARTIEGTRGEAAPVAAWLLKHAASNAIHDP